MVYCIFLGKYEDLQVLYSAIFLSQSEPRLMNAFELKLTFSH